MLSNYIRQRKLNRWGVMLLLLGVVFLSIAPFALAQSSDGHAEQTVNEFADFWTKMLTGPVSKIIAILLLVAAVLALFKGQPAAAIMCGVGFLVLMFIPRMIQGLFK